MNTSQGAVGWLYLRPKDICASQFGWKSEPKSSSVAARCANHYTMPNVIFKNKYFKLQSLMEPFKLLLSSKLYNIQTPGMPGLQMGTNYTCMLVLVFKIVSTRKKTSIIKMFAKINLYMKVKERHEELPHSLKMQRDGDYLLYKNTRTSCDIFVTAYSCVCISYIVPKI